MTKRNDIEYFTNIDLKYNSLKNVVVDVMTSEPSAAEKVGQIVTYNGNLYVGNASKVFKQLAIGGDVSTLTTRVETLEGYVGTGTTPAEGTLRANVTTLKTEVEADDTGLLDRTTSLEGRATTIETSLGTSSSTSTDTAWGMAKSKVTGILTTEVTETSGGRDTHVPSEKAIVTYVGGKVSGLFKFKGTVDVDPTTKLPNLPAIANVSVGDVYNVSEEFVYESKTYPAGTNVVCCEDTSTSPSTKYWDTLGGTIDVSALEKIANKTDEIGTGSATLYPSTKAVYDYAQPIVTGAATTIVSDTLTASMAVISNASGRVAVSSVTSTELGYVSGVTSAIQTQLNAKLDDGQLITTLSETASDEKIMSEALTRTQLATKVDKETGKSLLADTEITRLAGIETGAEVNIIEGIKLSDSESIINPDASRNVTIPAVTTDADGLMSSEDKVKLNGIDTGAQVNVIETVQLNGTALAVSSKTVNIPLSSSSQIGLMSTAQYDKLNGIAEGAQVNVLEAVKIGTTALTISDKAVTIPTVNTTTGSATDGLMTQSDKTKLDTYPALYSTVTTLIDGKVDKINLTTTGTYTKVTINAQGQVTSGQATIVCNDISDISTTYLGINANAVSASKLYTARTISLSGGATASDEFNGEANLNLEVTALNASKINAGKVGESYLPFAHHEAATLTFSGSGTEYTATITGIPYGLIVTDEDGNVINCAVQMTSSGATITATQAISGAKAYYMTYSAS